MTMYNNNKSISEVVKHDDRLELRLNPLGDYMQGDDFDLDHYLDEVLFWDDLYLEYNDWYYIYDANQGKWYNFPGLYMIDNIQVIKQMLMETTTTNEPLTLYEIDDAEILEELNEGL